MVDKLQKRTTSWNGRWLTWAGQIVILKVAILALPIYLLSCLALPSSKEKIINNHMMKFFRQGTPEQKKIPMIVWEKVCKLKEDGGLGIQNFLKQNTTLGAKLIWRMYTNNEGKWVKLLQKKYLNGDRVDEILLADNLPKGSHVWNFMRACRQLILDCLS